MNRHDVIVRRVSSGVLWHRRVNIISNNKLYISKYKYYNRRILMYSP
jgi:hypothetical protein